MLFTSDLTTLLTLAWTFMKVGALIFGGGYVMLPHLESEVVDQYHWLTHQEFIDAIAAGQATPGPIVVSAVFIGYKVGGVVGGILALVAILIPSFTLLSILVKHLPWFSEGPLAAFMKGMLPAAVGIIMAVAFSIAKTTITDTHMLLIAAASLLLLAWRRVDPPYVIIVCGIIGMLMM